MGYKVLFAALGRGGTETDAKDGGHCDEGIEGDIEVDLASLAPAQRMGLEAFGLAFGAAGQGRDWFAMSRELNRGRDAVQAVWYAAKVRDDSVG